MSSKKSNSKYWVRYLVILVIWFLVIGISFQARDRLSNQIQSSTNLINDDTRAGDGLKLYRDRFNISEDQIDHIIVLDIPDVGTYNEITHSTWRNYTLFLSYYLITEFGDQGYDQVVSEPIVLEQFQGDPSAEEIASSFVSDDGSSGLIYLSSSSLNLDDDEDKITDHVHEIRDLLDNYEGLIQFIELYAAQNAIPADFLISLIPDEDSIQAIDKLLTGTAANIVDTIEVSESSFRDSEIIAAIAIIIILTLVFRTPLGVAIPLIATVAALLPAYLITSFVADSGLFVVNDFLPSVIAMIGIAVAVDYNLFNLVRYREEYRKRQAEHEENGTWNKETQKEVQVDSSKVMNKTAGTAVMYSGTTVMIGFSALLLAGDDFSFGMAIGVSIVVLLSIITARTLTPSILGLFGRYLDWPNFMSRAKQDVEKQKEDGNHKTGFWVKWSNFVMKNPLKFLVLGLLILTPFLILSAQTQLSFSLIKSLPADTESRMGFEVIQDDFNLGQLNPYRIIIDGGPANNSVFDSDIIQKINEFASDVRNYDGTMRDGTGLNFASVSTLSYFKNTTSGEYVSFSLLQILGIFSMNDTIVVGQYMNGTPIVEQNYMKTSYVAHASQYLNMENGNNTIMISITSNFGPGSSESFTMVDTLKELSEEHFSELVDSNKIDDYYVTGLSALFKDSSDNMYDRVPLMLTVAVILIFLALMILFRSVILPIKAILTIAGSILFAIGTLVFVFQMGQVQLIEILGVTLWSADQVSLTYFLPVFLFTTILGLGMDYSIFIISRVREEYDKGAEMGDAVGLGLSKTAGVVTSAATIMIITFMVFALSPMLILKMFGLAMSVAIFIDATVARLILMPSAMKLAGKYNFWLPDWLEKILPKLDLKH